MMNNLLQINNTSACITARPRARKRKILRHWTGVFNPKNDGDSWTLFLERYGGGQYRGSPARGCGAGVAEVGTEAGSCSAQNEAPMICRVELRIAAMRTSTRIVRPFLA